MVRSLDAQQSNRLPQLLALRIDNEDLVRSRVGWHGDGCRGARGLGHRSSLSESRCPGWCQPHGIGGASAASNADRARPFRHRTTCGEHIVLR